MQGSKIKRHRCLNSCNNFRKSIDDPVTNDNQTKLPWTCFRLPFCDIKQNETNRVYEALVAHGPCYSHCGVQIQVKSDDDDDDHDTYYKIQPFINYFGNTNAKLKLPTHISCSNDEFSTIATDIANDRSYTHVDCNILATEETRYVSLDSLLRSTRTDDTTTTAVSTAEFSFESESMHRKMIYVQCKSCNVTLNSL